MILGQNTGSDEPITGSDEPITVQTLGASENGESTWWPCTRIPHAEAPGRETEGVYPAVNKYD